MKLFLIASLACAACAVAAPSADVSPQPPARDAGAVKPDASEPTPTVDASVPLPACDGGGLAPPANGSHLSDPSVTVTPTTDGYVLHKELAGYPNYGASDDAADGLYTGETGAWTFPIPAGTVASATVTVQIIDDDHGPGSGYTDVPTNLYSYRLWAGSCAYDDSGLAHGTPYGSSFIDWEQRTYPAEGLTPGASYEVSLTNTSSTGTIDWVAIDWIEIHVTTGTAPN